MMEATQPLVSAEDFRAPGAAPRHCEALEEGKILFFPSTPFEFPEADREFLVGLRQRGSRFHKNISYRPQQDMLRGFSSDLPGENERAHRMMRDYSQRVTRFLSEVLAPYAPHWSLDFASFRPFEEHGRDLPLNKRNDLLHVDAFPTRPTNGGRILRVFTNLNPQVPRVWITTDGFPVLARRYADSAGLPQFAAKSGSARDWERKVLALKRMVGLRTIDRSPYDQFMLRFHTWLKEANEFQEQCPKIRMEFPPLSTWIVFTDAVPHAVLSGQFAIEQTYIVPVGALVHPEKSPLRVLEDRCGRPLSD